MADFGTILNPQNTTLNLFCNSITAEHLIINELDVVNINVSGSATINNLEVDGTANINNLNVTNAVISNASIETLVVSGTSDLQGNVICENNLQVNGNETINGTLSIGSLTENNPVWTDLNKELISFNTPYFYGNQLMAINYNVAENVPVLVTPVISNNISIGVDNSTFSFVTNGVYNFQFTCVGGNSTADDVANSLPSPVLGIQVSLYDATNTFVSSSKLEYTTFPNLNHLTSQEYPTILTTNCLLRVLTGYTVIFVYTPITTPTNFNVTLSNVNLNITYVSP